jgi:hypothetical protein
MSVPPVTHAAAERVEQRSAQLTSKQELETRIRDGLDELKRIATALSPGEVAAGQH